MVRFIHTADWQLGLRVNYITGDAGAVVRDARLDTVDRIGRLAREQDAQFVVVAGDVFEHHGIATERVRKTFDHLRDYPCPVYLLPGNHDPLTAESLYRSQLWAREAPSQIHVLTGTEPVEAPGAWLFPCPLTERHTLLDVTEHLTPEFGPQGVVRVGVAHGSVKEILSSMRGDNDGPMINPVRMNAAEAGALDYLALGDWHGTLRVTPRTWYSGAPEATRFKEKDPGSVLLVEIEAPGAPPRVTPHAVQTLTWIQHDAEVSHPEDREALADFLETLPNKRHTLVELFLQGTLDGAGDSELGALLEKFRDRFCWLRPREEKLSVILDDAELDHIGRDGWLKEVVDELKKRRDHDPGDRDALNLLYRLHEGTNQ